MLNRTIFRFLNMVEWFRRRELQKEIKALIHDFEHSKDLQEAAFQRGFSHGQNKTVPLLKKLAFWEAEAHKWRRKYKGEVPSLKYYISELRKHVSPEVFNAVMQTRRGPRESCRDKQTKGCAACGVGLLELCPPCADRGHGLTLADFETYETGVWGPGGNPDKWEERP